MDKGEYGLPIADCELPIEPISIGNSQFAIDNQYAPLCICSPTGIRFGVRHGGQQCRPTAFPGKTKPGTAFLIAVPV
jgi:hypothetical protein